MVARDEALLVLLLIIEVPALIGLLVVQFPVSLICMF